MRRWWSPAPFYSVGDRRNFFVADLRFLISNRRSIDDRFGLLARRGRGGRSTERSISRSFFRQSFRFLV
jgi:hypothetical protein